MRAFPTQIRFDESTKEQAAEVLAALDLPFEASYPEYKPEVIEALKEAKAVSQDLSSPRFDSFSDALKDMDL